MAGPSHDRLMEVEDMLNTAIREQLEEEPDEVCPGCTADRVIKRIPETGDQIDLLRALVRDCVAHAVDPPVADDVYAAIEVLFRHRHTLPNDVLRTLQCIWTCCSAARFGEPYERFWIDSDDRYRSHNTAECEAGA